MSTPQNSSDKTLILPYQKPIYDRLSAVARACLYVDRSQFSAIKLRTCFLLIGPTGTGKTFLSNSLAVELGLPFFVIPTTTVAQMTGLSPKSVSNKFPMTEVSSQRRGVIMKTLREYLQKNTRQPNP